MYQLTKFKKIKGLIHGISSKKDGNLSYNWGLKVEVLSSRKKFLKKLNISLNQCVTCALSHSIKIQKVTKKDQGKMLGNSPIQADALLTFEKDLYLFLLVGDYLPIIFFDPKKEILVLAHLGWKNTDKLFCKKIVRTLQKLGAKPEEILVGIGPGIHKSSYIKEKDIPDWGKFTQKISDTKTRIDLIGYNQEQLLQIGVLAKNLEVSSIDTVKSQDFFSHWRAKRTKEPEGRFAMVVGML